MTTIASLHHRRAQNREHKKIALEDFLMRLCLVASIFQFYIIKREAVSISLYLISIIAIFPIVNWRIVLSRSTGITAILFIVYQIFSWSWAPSIISGIRDLYFSALYIILFGTLITIGDRNPERAFGLGRFYCVVAIIQSMMVILFRLVPSLELAFLTSPVVSIFISNSSMDASFLQTANVMAPDKAGGLLLAANAAGAWSAALFFLTLALWKMDWSKSWLLPICFIHLCAAVLCGSKGTPIIIAAAVLILIIVRAIRGVSGTLLGVILFSGGAALLMIAYAINFDLLDGNVFVDSKLALDSRSVMWNFAFTKFLEHPLIGLGYGGWGEAFYNVGESYRNLGVNGNLAPHNLFIIVWSQTGIIGVLLAIAFIVAALASCWPKSRSKSLFVSMCLTGAVLVYMLQSLGENYALFSNQYLSAVLAVTLGLASANHIRYPRASKRILRARNVGN